MACLRTLFLILALGSVLPDVSLAAPPEIAKPRAFQLWYISGKGGASIVIGMILQEIGGNIAICGAVWPQDERRSSIASQNHEFHKSVIKVRGKIVPASLDVFPFYDTRDAAKTFRCSVSDQPWQGPYKSDDFRLR
jgi:hypothetical protein